MHVGHWKFESYNIWAPLVRRPIYQNRIICTLDMVHEYVHLPRQMAVSKVTLMSFSHYCNLDSSTCCLSLLLLSR